MILHLVTDAARYSRASDVPGIRAYLLAIAEGAIDAGIDMLQVREPELSARDLESLVRDIVAIASGTAMRVLVNDRLDVAVSAGASGVHLKESSIPVARARTIAPSGFVIGRSVHSVPAPEDVRGADYLIGGTVWPTASKSEGHPTVGVSGLRAMTAATDLPVLAIGGVTTERINDVSQAGAAGIAAIGLFASIPSGELRALAQELRQRFDSIV